MVSRPEALGNAVGQSVLAMITSAAHSRWPLDVPLTDLAAAGLPAPSVVRMKLFTLDDRLVERRRGRQLGRGGREPPCKPHSRRAARRVTVARTLTWRTQTSPRR